MLPQVRERFAGADLREHTQLPGEPGARAARYYGDYDGIPNGGEMQQIMTVGIVPIPSLVSVASTNLALLSTRLDPEDVANLVDIVLVIAFGLLVALLASRRRALYQDLRCKALALRVIDQKMFLSKFTYCVHGLGFRSQGLT